MFTNVINALGLNTRQIILCVCLIIWELIRKGIALYRAGQRSDFLRFIFIFVLNTCGILPIIYLILTGNSKRK